MINLLNLEPSVVTRTLKDKYFLIYGGEKVGKTTLAASFPKNLILATEIGTNAIPNIFVQPIKRWSDFELVVSQLKRPQVKEKFDTVTIDTISLLWDLCEQYVIDVFDVSTLSEVPYGGGWRKVKSIFSNQLNAITQEGYGLILICHSKRTALEKNENEKKSIVNFFNEPNLTSACSAICNKIADCTLFVEVQHNEKGEETGRFLRTTGNKFTIAGGRFTFKNPLIPLSYDALVSEIESYIDDLENDGAKVVEKIEKKEVAVDFNATLGEAKQIWINLFSDYSKRRQAGETTEEEDTTATQKLKIARSIIKNEAGVDAISDISPTQVDNLLVIISKLKEL